ncbi:hypothetical protein MNEG_9311 [Monoraphidium neglectum]|uniref:Uncharacterized protein n=1 Tax=Monoraphidium neglectum TaxID=145388 RepID=A0A0D2MWR5_9CHLO|nr:hypothetical protein MNEG_9311 [Monoraphidium neglectum]KIY98650.1 hypothetical protein MNEG_9311 [Monoraphidium neglectum]|eukprot:XP_013897670.1 hypothetical protein MNEG_9311 [Monoraphidium neglectum]
MVHQLLLEAAERLPRPEASPAPAPRGVLVPQAARAGSAPLETVPELPRVEDANHQMQALHSSRHKRDRSIQFNEDDRGFWAQSLEELMAAIAPHNAARVAPAAPSGDNHKPAAGSC